VVRLNRADETFALRIKFQTDDCIIHALKQQNFLQATCNKFNWADRAGGSRAGGMPGVYQGYLLGYIRGIRRGMSGVYEPGLWGIKGYKRVYIRDS
jgi:hypothetical protein